MPTEEASAAVSERARPCPICGAPTRDVEFRELGVALLRCPPPPRGCTHVFSTHEAEPDADHFWGADAGAPDAFSMYYWHDARLPVYREFLRRFDASRGHLVDVGAGLGFFVKTARDAGWDAEGWEIARPAVEWGRKELGLTALHEGRVQDAPLAPGSVDAVTLWDVIEHLPDPLEILGWARGVLRPGGLLFLQTPNVDFQLRRARLVRRLRGTGEETNLLEARDHINDFTHRSMEEALGRAGFTSWRFVVMRPTYALAMGRARLGIAAKLAWWQAARALFAASGGRVRISNTIHVAAWR